MADGLTANISGIVEIDAKLKALGTGLRKKGMRFAMRKGANLVRDRARKKAEAFDDAGTPQSVAKNIAVRFSGSTFRRNGDIKFRIGILGGAKAPSGNIKQSRASDKYLKPKAGAPGGLTFYWRFKEFGTRHQRAQPFMRPAIENGQQQVFDTIAGEGEKWLERAVKKL